MNSSPAVVQCQDLSKSFHDAHMNVDVLNNLTFTINVGERVAIVGASGSGKSTLLHLLGGLDKPSSGEVLIYGQNISIMGEAKKSLFRNQNLGFVYQFHHLLPEFTAMENIALPLLIRGLNPKEAKEKSEYMLQQVGLKDRVKHKPGELSGGERQRAAIARALVTEPKCVLADEPTGNLDTDTASKVYNMMLSLNETLNTSFIVVTHDMSLAEKMDRILKLENGYLSEIKN